MKSVKSVLTLATLTLLFTTACAPKSQPEATGDNKNPSPKAVVLKDWKTETRTIEQRPTPVLEATVTDLTAGQLASQIIYVEAPELGANVNTSTRADIYFDYDFEDGKGPFFCQVGIVPLRRLNNGVEFAFNGSNDLCEAMAAERALKEYRLRLILMPANSDQIAAIVLIPLTPPQAQ